MVDQQELGLSLDKPEPFIVLVYPDSLPDIWLRVEGYLRIIADESRGRLTLENIVIYIINGSWKLWVIFEGDEVLAVATAEIIDHPQLRVLHGTGIAGRNRKKWVHLLSVVEDWAREQGCNAIQLSTRAGFGKDLPNYTATHVLFEKSLEVYDA